MALTMNFSSASIFTPGLYWNTFVVVPSRYYNKVDFNTDHAPSDDDRERIMAFSNVFFKLTDMCQIVTFSVHTNFGTPELGINRVLIIYASDRKTRG